MIKSDYKRLINPPLRIRTASFQDHDPGNPRTLIYAENPQDCHATHIYIKEDGLHVLHYISGVLRRDKMSHTTARTLPNACFLTIHPVHPEKSDYKFCEHLLQNGVTLLFDSFDTGNPGPGPNGFYGPTAEDFQ